MKFLSLIALLFPLVAAAAPAKNQVASQTKFIENGQLKIGVDLTSGGSIFWFSELPADRNLLNHADRGRFIQQSYYGKKDGSVWAKKPWRWNPVQGGDYKGKPARLLEVKAEKESLYTHSIPVNWAGGQDIEDCRMEQRITLDDTMAKIRFRFVYSGQENHPPTHQELPAVFMDYALTDLVYYDGDTPWTNAPIKKDRPGWPNEQRKPTENWAGFVGADGRGVGVSFPGTDRITTYRHPGPAGPKGGGCSYFAPIRTMAIGPGTDFRYEIALTIGSAEEMRTRFSKKDPPLPSPAPEK
ncbi:MAG: hypothetical protein ACKO2G_10095 [Verrucomicrobiales bacterium]